MPTLTEEYEFNLPIPGSDDNNWGDLLNANWEKVDGLVKTLHNKIAQQLINIHYRVGAIKFTTENVNPGTYIPGTTWALYGGGRAFVGVGSAAGVTWAAGQTRGTAEEVLTVSQIPSHRHHNQPPNFYSDYAGQHTHTIDGMRRGAVETGTNRQSFQQGPEDNVYTNAAGNHRHYNRPATFWGGFTGGGNAHNNIQPSIAIYAWRRTS